MKRLCRKWTAAMCALVVMGFVAPTVAQDVKRITKEDLKSMLSDPSVIVVDVRAKGDWESSGFKIKGAVREDPGKATSWMSKYEKDKTLVFYCA